MKRTILVSAAAVSIVLLASCSIVRNNPYDPASGDAYIGWQVSWADPVQVVEGPNHTNGVEYSNGFPQGLAMGGDDTLHVVAYRVSPSGWYYIRKPAGSDTFDQSSIKQFGSGAYPDIHPPQIILLTDNSPVFSYIDTSGADRVLYYRSDGSGGFAAEQVIFTSSSSLSALRMFFFTSDLLKPRFYFIDGAALKYTIRNNSVSISPDPPAVVISDVSLYSAVQNASNDVTFLFTDSGEKDLFITSIGDPAVEKIWSAIREDEVISNIDLKKDLSGSMHAIVSTHKAGEIANPEWYTLRYFTNASGKWMEGDSFIGTTESGVYPNLSNLVVTLDIGGTSRVHLFFDELKPVLNTRPQYAYYGTDGWVLAASNLDPEHANAVSFPSALADSHGNLHAVFSWNAGGNTRTLLYAKGSAGESQAP